MSVHSHTVAQHPAATPEFPRHVVTAVLVAHDGARWLPESLTALLGQERPVQSVIAADTGSADDSARLLSESLGADRVLHMARRTGFGAAVDEAARTARVLTPEDLPYLKRPSGWDPVTRSWRDEAYDMPELPHGEPVQWLWLLHDDCAPEPDALAELLRVVDADPSVTVAGPKLRGWYDRRQLLEAGVSIANSGRRWTGVERREQDQGQHDQVRPVLSVSTAGMLVRRDVFEALGGFDRRLPLMRDDVDLCWRAHAAGHRVMVVPDAVARHAEAASRERRPVDCVGRASRGASPHRVDKAGAVYTLLVNARAAVLPWVLLRLVVGTVLRTLAYLVGKVPGQALDEIAGLSATLLRPGRIIAARRRRGKPHVPHTELRALFPPPGATVRATAEQVASNLGGRSEPELSSGGRHGAVESGPGDDDADFLEVDQFARARRLAGKPAPVLFAVLLLVSLVACRALLGGGALAGGALLPAPADVSDLWARYTEGWHPVGTGGTESAPPYLALVAAVSTLLFGSTGLALTLLLVCSVPLAGLTAYFASRPLVESRLVRAWASVTYAFLPAATGALAGGRIGTAVLAVLLPLLARAAVASGGLRGKPSWRAAWGYGLLLALATAFTPIVWPVALVLAAAALVWHWRSGGRALRAVALRQLAALLTPLALLAPWSLALLTSPGDLLSEVGLPYGTGSASVLDLLTLSPGGPGALGGLLLGGVLLAALAALLRGERVTAIRAAWLAALVGLLFAGLSNGSAWAGPATLVYGVGLLSAAALGAEGAKERVAEQSFGWRQPAAVLIAAAAVAAPLLSAVNWMVDGADTPLSRRDPVQVPAFVAEESGTRDQARTLVLSGSADASDVRYSLVRGSGARLGDADLAAAMGTESGLDRVVSHLVAGSGADQSSQLGGYAVRYVLVRDGAPREMSRVLDTTPGLTRLSQEDGSALWRVDSEVSRLAVVPGQRENGAAGAVTAPVPVAAGAVEAHTELPDGPAGRVLRLADAADPGWRATLDGAALQKTTVDGWAQGFELPTNGGQLDLTYEPPASHGLWLWGQAALVVVVVVLALPGRRREVDDDLPEEPVVPAQPVAGEGRRARRLRAAAAGAESGAEATSAEPPRPPDGLAPPPQDPALIPGQAPPPPPPAYVPEQGVPGQQSPPPGYPAGEAPPPPPGDAPAYPVPPDPYGADPYGAAPYGGDPYGADPYGYQGGQAYQEAPGHQGQQGYPSQQGQQGHQGHGGHDGAAGSPYGNGSAQQ
ncbi:glycosyltransferase family 2 protein [Streptomyces sp. AJS327]|uniref:glycosyltransferase family 2 protein n=1 Tax=Streptomyces sp. AJS327 TaxID=2545265 RepID=UPI0015DEE9E9|nr:glycosyltransferase family 2 protein [Streptomyces sp. AJS327]MBA0049476.1 glycosyltransferase family 2 protein [Streptomyces sp. AJS327]